jgi:ABC-2 type transport system permease protein
MMRIGVLRAIAGMTLRDFVRTPEAVFWSYGFPLIMALVLGFAFSRGEVPEVRIGVVDVGWTEAGWPQLDAESPAAEAHYRDIGSPAGLLASILQASPRKNLDVRVLAPAEARARLARGRVDVLVVPHVLGRDQLVGAGPDEALQGMAEGRIALDAALQFDPTRPESDLARTIVELALDRQRLATLRTEPLAPRPIEEIVEPGSRYIDFLIPGLIGLNLLGSGLFGIGFNLVQMRVNKMLRRLAVTPMRRSEFLAAFLIGRILLNIPETAVVVLFGRFVFGVPLALADLPLLCLIVALGTLTFSGLGLLVASRARTIEAVSGLMNLAMVPMWLLGGCFFSVERFPDVFWPLIACVPMYWFTEATRDVMLSGAGVLSVWPALAILAAWAVGSFALAVRLFRWQ